MTGYKGTLDSKTYERILNEVIKIIREYLKYDSDVADLGCHDDYMLSRIIRCKTYSLVDKKIVKNYDFYAEKVKFYEMDVNEFVDRSLHVNKFDVIIMASLIEHLDFIECKVLLQKIRHILKDDGILIITYPNCKSVNRMLGVDMGLIPYYSYLDKGDIELGHKAMYGPSYLIDIEHHSKLELIRKEGIMFKPIPNSMMDKYFSNDLDKFIDVGKEIGYEYCAMILGVFKK